MNAETKEHPQRTGQQNKAIHKYFGMVADALNARGHFLIVQVGHVQRKRRWTGDFVKEHIWRPLQIAEFNEYSTTMLRTIDPSVVYDHMNAFLSGEFGLHVPFPDRHREDLREVA